MPEFNLSVKVNRPTNETSIKISPEEISSFTIPLIINSVLAKNSVTKKTALVVIFHGVSLICKDVLAKIVAITLQTTSPHSTGTSKNESDGNSRQTKETINR